MLRSLLNEGPTQPRKRCKLNEHTHLKPHTKARPLAAPAASLNNTMYHTARLWIPCQLSDTQKYISLLTR